MAGLAGREVRALSMPVPLSATVVGLLLALLVTVSVPVRVPPAVGVKFTVTVQEPPTAMRGAVVGLAEVAGDRDP